MFGNYNCAKNYKGLATREASSSFFFLTNFFSYIFFVGLKHFSKKLVEAASVLVATRQAVLFRQWIFAIQTNVNKRKTLDDFCWKSKPFFKKKLTLLKPHHAFKNAPSFLKRMKIFILLRYFMLENYPWTLIIKAFLIFNYKFTHRLWPIFVV